MAVVFRQMRGVFLSFPLLLLFLVSSVFSLPALSAEQKSQPADLKINLLDVFERDCNSGYTECVKSFYSIPDTVFYTVKTNWMIDRCYKQADGTCLQVARLFYTGDTVEKNMAKALVLAQKSCDEGASAGCMLLGILYLDDGNEDAGHRWLNAACAKGETSACFLVDRSAADNVDYIAALNDVKNLALYDEPCLLDNTLNGCSAYADNKGEGVEKHTSLTVYLYIMACDVGYAPACTNLGYELSLDGTKTIHEVVNLYKKGCAGGDPQGCINLGIIHQDGVYGFKDRKRALGYFQQGCDLNSMASCSNLAYMYTSNDAIPLNYPKAIELYQHSCRSGDGMGCSNLGVLYALGQGVKQDAAKAVELYKQSCTVNDGLGCGNLAYKYETGVGINKNFQKAAQFYTKGCKYHNGKSCHNLAIFFEQGTAAQEDITLAVKYFTAGCQYQYYLSCVYAGRHHEHGSVGIPKSYSEARGLYEKACNNKIVNGCTDLGLLYEYGRGVFKNLLTAADYYKRSCNGKIERGCTRIKKLYNKSFSTKSESKQFYLSFCEAGHFNPCGRLGTHLIDEGDILQGVKYLNKACNGKVSSACNHLGIIYAEGTLVAKDAVKSALLFYKACTAKNTIACNNLRLLQTKDGIKKQG